MAELASVPVYLPDRTIVGSAVVDVKSGTAVITLQTDSSLAEIIQENLVGLSVIYMNRELAEDIHHKHDQNKEKN